MLRRPHLHDSAAELLRARVRVARRAGESRLPTEQQLMEELGVSRQTVREALRALEAEGLLIRRQGVGTIISSPTSIEAGIEVLESNLDSIRRAGYVAESLLLSIDRLTLPSAVTACLVGPDAAPTDGFRTTTVFTADGKPVIYSIAYVTESRVGSPEVMEMRRRLSSMRDFFTRGLNVEVHHARVAIMAERADETVARRLDLAPGDPILVLEGPAFDTSNTPLYYLRASVRTDHYRFTLVRRKLSSGDRAQP